MHENFQIMTHVRFKPTSNYQFAGLLVYLDEETMLWLGRAYCNRQKVCVGNGIYFDAVQNGQSLEKNFATDTQIKDDAYLRIDKNGTKFTGYYSENGTDWMMIGEHESLSNRSTGGAHNRQFIYRRDDRVLRLFHSDGNTLSRTELLQYLAGFAGSVFAFIRRAGRGIRQLDLGRRAVSGND